MARGSTTKPPWNRNMRGVGERGSDWGSGSGEKKKKKREKRLKIWKRRFIVWEVILRVRNRRDTGLG